MASLLDTYTDLVSHPGFAQNPAAQRRAADLRAQALPLYQQIVSSPRFGANPQAQGVAHQIRAAGLVKDPTQGGLISPAAVAQSANRALGRALGTSPSINALPGLGGGPSLFPAPRVNKPLPGTPLPTLASRMAANAGGGALRQGATRPNSGRTQIDAPVYASHAPMTSIAPGKANAGQAWLNAPVYASHTPVPSIAPGPAIVLHGPPPIPSHKPLYQTPAAARVSSAPDREGDQDPGWWENFKEATHDIYGDLHDGQSSSALLAGAIARPISAATAWAGGLQPLAPGQQPTKVQQAVRSIPDAVGNLAAGAITFVPVSAEKITTAALSPFNTQARQAYHQDADAQINSAGLGAKGPVTRILHGDVRGGVGQLIDKAEEDPATAIATVAGGWSMLRGAGVGAQSLYRDGLYSRGASWLNRADALSEAGQSQAATVARQKGLALRQAGDAVQGKMQEAALLRNPHVNDPDVRAKLDAMSQGAKQRLSQNLKTQLSRANIGIEPSVFTDLGTIMAAEIAKQRVTSDNAADWLKANYRNYAQEVTPHSNAIFQRGLDVIHRAITEKPTGIGSNNYGPEYSQFSNDPDAAITHLALVGKGYVPDLLGHDSVPGRITLQYGDPPLGLTQVGGKAAIKLIDKHPSAVFNLQRLLSQTRLAPPRLVFKNGIWVNPRPDQITLKNNPGTVTAVVDKVRNPNTGQDIHFLNTLYEDDPFAATPTPPPGQVQPLPRIVQELFKKGRMPQGGLMTQLNRDGNVVKNNIPALEQMADWADNRIQARKRAMRR